MSVTPSRREQPSAAPSIPYHVGRDLHSARVGVTDRNCTQWRTDLRRRSWPDGLAIAVVVAMKFSDRTKRARARRLLPVALFASVVLAGDGLEAAEPPISVGELSTPPATSSTD